MSFLRECFSEDGQGSASRLMMGFHALIGSIGFLHVVFHNHALPDAVTLAGLTAFVTAPYAVNALHLAVNSVSRAKGEPVAGA